VIVVAGAAGYRPASSAIGTVVGCAPEIAVAAAAAGSTVELLAKIGDDGAGEELLLALARAGVGHLAVLRDPARPTALAPTADPPDGDEEDDDPVAALLAEVDAAAARSPDRRPPTVVPLPVLEPDDVSLGLRYLRDYRVVVAVEPLGEGGAAVVADAATFADAHLVVVGEPDAIPDAAYAAATVLEAPRDDPDGAFAALVGRLAAALDRGVSPADALHEAAAAGGWEPAPG
jgi:hypothetical protein